MSTMNEQPMADEHAEDYCLLALSCSNRRWGIACYEELSNTIYCDNIPIAVEDMEETLLNLKSSLRPTQFLLHPKIISNKSLLDLILLGPDGSPDFYRFKVLRSSAWKDAICSQLIHTCLQIRGRVSGLTNLTAGYQHISSILDLEDDAARQALGALIGYCQESIFKLDEGKVVVAAVKQIVQQSYLRMDQASFKALHIFSEEIHPNVIKGKGRSKEGFSLFGLFDRTHSMPGRQRLKDWMSRPYCDLEKIQHRQMGVALFVRCSQGDFVRAVTPLLKHFHDIPRLMLRVKKVEATFVEWSKLNTSICTGIQIIGHMQLYINSPITAQADAHYIRSLCIDLDLNAMQFVAQQLEGAIDFQESEVEGSIVFNSNYDETLDTMRNVLHHLSTHLEQAATRILDVVPLLQNVTVEYVPQVGYLVAVGEENSHLLLTSAADKDAGPATAVAAAAGDRFTFVYQQAGIHYFKHRIVEEMDENIGDIKSEIIDRQRFLLLQIEDLVLDAEEQLQQLTYVLSSVDALMSLAALAIEQNLTQPEMTDDIGSVLIKNGRHLLQELTVDNFVPNDTFLSSTKNIGLITGPNNSGKSIYLKQVALIVYLAHIGSFVPCERARIGLTDRILTRISSTETVSCPQSAFALDLQQISRMLNSHTSRSLCFIDEFGKGTNPVDGISLLAAVIQHFTVTGRGAAIFVLHFTEILHDNILNPNDMERISCFRMETYEANRAGTFTSAGVRSVGGGDVGAAASSTSTGYDDDDDVGDGHDTNTTRSSSSSCLFYWAERTPLFKLKKGVAPSSEGMACAKSAGLTDAVLQRAVRVKQMVQQRQPIQVDCQQQVSLLQDTRALQLLQLFLLHHQWIDASDEGEKRLHNFQELL